MGDHGRPRETTTYLNCGFFCLGIHSTLRNLGRPRGTILSCTTDLGLGTKALNSGRPRETTPSKTTDFAFAHPFNSGGPRETTLSCTTDFEADDPNHSTLGDHGGPTVDHTVLSYGFCVWESIQLWETMGDHTVLHYGFRVLGMKALESGRPRETTLDYRFYVWESIQLWDTTGYQTVLHYGF